MSKVLVTGGAGFIGSHIAHALCRKRCPVRVLDNFSSGKKENLVSVLDKIELVRADIRSKAACLKATKNIDFVLHQAALTSVPDSFKDPHAYREVNIDGTLNLLEAALRNKVKRFIFASSCAVYGDSPKLPQRESDLPNPLSPYAESKLAGEAHCRIFSKDYGLDTVCLRYFNVFGPRQSLEGEYAVVIPKFIACMLGDEPPPIFGNGKQTRDFIYVDNIIEANILSTKKRTNFGGQIFNIASGRECSILELVKILNKLMGRDLSPHFFPKRKGDIFRSYADISGARKVLGFRPKIDLIQGLRLTKHAYEAASA